MSLWKQQAFVAFAGNFAKVGVVVVVQPSISAIVFV